MKRLFSTLLVAALPWASFAQTAPYPTQLDLEHATWADGDVLVRFADPVAVKFTLDCKIHSNCTTYSTRNCTT